MKGGAFLKRRELIKILEGAGYKFVRSGGDHDVYCNDAKKRIPIPRHTEIKENLAKAILKEAGLL